MIHSGPSDAVAPAARAASRSDGLTGGSPRATRNVEFKILDLLENAGAAAGRLAGEPPASGSGTSRRASRRRAEHPTESGVHGPCGGARGLSSRFTVRANCRVPPVHVLQLAPYTNAMRIPGVVIVNVKEPVRVRLTSRGRAFLEASRTRRTVRRDGILEVPLSELMAIFGRYLQADNPLSWADPLFVDDELSVGQGVTLVPDDDELGPEEPPSIGPRQVIERTK